LIVSDDLDLPFGVLRLRPQGSAGGHNGLASIFEQVGTLKVPRLKIGIGRGPSTATAHVLSRFSAEQEREMAQLVERAADGVEAWARDGIVVAMNDVNRKGDEQERDGESRRPTG
jgi:peptidyl-tRNA hydrolase, PTH1 family